MHVVHGGGGVSTGGHGTNSMMHAGKDAPAEGEVKIRTVLASKSYSGFFCFVFSVCVCVCVRARAGVCERCPLLRHTNMVDCFQATRVFVVMFVFR